MSELTRSQVSSVPNHATVTAERMAAALSAGPRTPAAGAPARASLRRRAAGKVRHLGRRAVVIMCARSVPIRDVRVEPPADLAPVIPRQAIDLDLRKYRFDGSPRPYWMDLGTIEADPVYVLPVPRGEVIRGGIVVDRDGQIVLESAIFQRYYLEKLRSERYLLARPVLPRQRLGRVICLSNYLESNYFHWVTESLTRLAVLHADQLAGRQVLICRDAPRFERESLEFLFGLGEDHVVEQQRPRVTTDECLVVSFPHTRNERTRWTNVYQPSVLRRLNALALARAGVRSRRTGGGINLLISRAGARGRRILNEDALLRRFPALDLQVVRLERLSFERQVRLLADANVVIATHGAGLTGMLFARSPFVVELFPAGRNVRDACYFAQISAALGFPHAMLAYVPANQQQDLLLTDALLDRVARVLAEHGITV